MKFIACLLALLVSTMAFAQSPTSIGWGEARERYINQLGNTGNTVVVKTHRSVIDFDAVPRASGAVFSLPGTIPTHAIITNSFYEIKRAVVSSNNNTVSIGCDSATDLMGPHILPGFASGTLRQASITGFSSYVRVDASCRPEVTIGSGASGITKGKLVIFFEYLVSE